MNRWRLIIFIIAFPMVASAKLGTLTSFATFTSQYSFYSDLKLNSETASQELTSSIDVEAGLKLYRAFYLLLVGTQATDQTRSGFGVGARIDLPGFLFFGARRDAFRKRSKTFPVNTSAYIHSLLVDSDQDSGGKKKSVASRYGFSMEIFMFNEVSYLHTDLSLYTFDGNSFFTYAVGLGFEF